MKTKLEICALVPAFFIALAATGAIGCTGGQGSVPTNTDRGAKAAKAPEYRIVITGGRTSPVTISYADLKVMGLEKRDATMLRADGASVTSVFAGVPMSKLLTEAGVPDGDVTFQLTDPAGYAVSYTREEMRNALLALTKNGVVLKSDLNANPIQLVVPGAPGARWIKAPVTIDITPALP
jgi:DMSO/TMAO reductase YedYZ molybdopterin-dependent catalytic subunit